MWSDGKTYKLAQIARKLTYSENYILRHLSTVRVSDSPFEGSAPMSTTAQNVIGFLTTKYIDVSFENKSVRGSRNYFIDFYIVRKQII